MGQQVAEAGSTTAIDIFQLCFFASAIARHDGLLRVVEIDRCAIGNVEWHRLESARRGLRRVPELAGDAIRTAPNNAANT